ncbi:MAG: sigma-70 family RNA polymerase sigma factor [Polyangiales bacterium]
MTPPHETSLDLRSLDEAVARVRRGDAHAFAVIVNGTQHRLVRLGARLLGSAADGEDAAQEAYVRAYRAIVDGKFDGRSKVDTWLYRIMTNVALDALRARSRRPVSDEIPEGLAGSGEAEATAHVSLRELDSLLKDLPPDQRIALTLQAMEGFTAKEIAELTDSTEGAVEQRLVRARAELRRKHRGHDGTE